MKKNPVLLVFSHVFLGFALTPVLAQSPTPAPTAPITPLRDRLTQVLPDRRVTFRLLAPKANAVAIIIGIKSGPYETQGPTTVEMTKDTNGLWSATLGPLEPNLYEYQFNLDGRKIIDPGNDIPTQSCQAEPIACSSGDGRSMIFCKRSLGPESDNKSSGPARSAKGYLQSGLAPVELAKERRGKSTVRSSSLPRFDLKDYLIDSAAFSEREFSNRVFPFPCRARVSLSEITWKGVNNTVTRRPSSI